MRQINSILSITILLFFFCNSIQLTAQNDCESRYKSRVFNSIQVFRNVVYTEDAPSLLAASLGTETTYNQNLVMDIFMPPPSDTVSNRPVIILAHGGGFINVTFMGGTVLVGTKDNDDVQALADTLAHWGFVTASIQYRVGFDVLSGTSIKRAVWRGAQDMSAATRFFRKNAQWFDIDPNRLFVGGSSAGAFCALHSTFVDSDERIPESLQQNLLAADLGAMHSRPVVELTGFNPFMGSNVLADDVDSIAQGVISYWGAIANTDMLSGNNSAPLRMFHGGSDPIVSSQCAKPFSNVILVAPVTCGSEIIDSVMTTLGLPHETTIEPGESHEYWGVLNGLWTTTGPNAYWKPIIDETADYFYEIMRPAAPTITGPISVAPQVNYTYSVANPNPNSSYCWDIGGGVILSPDPTAATVEVQFFNATTIGVINVQEIGAADVASNSAQHLATVSSSTAMVSQETASIQLYPSPIQDYLMVEFDGAETSIFVLEIWDSRGHLLYRQSHHDPKVRLQTSAYANGLYLVRVSTENQSWVEKVLVQH